MQLGVVGVMTLGDQLFAYLGMEPPALYVANRERRVGVCLGAWLLGNAAHNALTATGAFEVFYDGRLVRALLPKRSRRANAWAPGCSAAWRAPRAWTAGPSGLRPCVRPPDDVLCRVEMVAAASRALRLEAPVLMCPRAGTV